MTKWTQQKPLLSAQVLIGNVFICLRSLTPPPLTPPVSDKTIHEPRGSLSSIFLVTSVNFPPDSIKYEPPSQERAAECKKRMNRGVRLTQHLSLHNTMIVQSNVWLISSICHTFVYVWYEKWKGRAGVSSWGMFGYFDRRRGGIKEMDEGVKNSRVTQPFLLQLMDNNSSAESGRVYLENENVAGSTACNKTPPSCIHPERPPLILHTVSELPDGFILRLLSELKLKSVTEQLASSLWTGFTFLFVRRENLIRWPQTDGWQIGEQTWINELRNASTQNATAHWVGWWKWRESCAVASRVTGSE